MSFEDRVRQLLAKGQHEQARSFLVGVLGNQPVSDVTLVNDGVQVTTPKFVGVHTISPSVSELRTYYAEHGRLPAVSQLDVEGARYRLRDSDISMTVPTQRIHVDAVEAHLEELIVDMGFELTRDAAPGRSLEEPSDTRGDVRDGHPLAATPTFDGGEVDPVERSDPTEPTEPRGATDEEEASTAATDPAAAADDGSFLDSIRRYLFD
ncbi:hypothetical protein [Halomarina ordinaria]|uniref:YokE-like PH domain-containing protein n=1 Tax=Halomarina ordinaria TaxID=3033939 RepID=A0ABD5UF05_9EURY|nr:hypothetical protein [Halomarina sp. PSRA2]